MQKLGGGGGGGGGNSGGADGESASMEDIPATLPMGESVVDGAGDTGGGRGQEQLPLFSPSPEL